MSNQCYVMCGYIDNDYVQQKGIFSEIEILTNRQV